MTPDPRLPRHAAFARDMLEAAKKAAFRPDRQSGWEDPDPTDVGMILNAALALYLDEQRRASLLTGMTIVTPSVQFRFTVCGWHLPGHVENGLPVVYMAPPGAAQGIPPDALALAVIVPVGREDDLRKTYPEMK